MAIPECTTLPTLPTPKEITFPGGATLSQVLAAGSEIPDSLDSVTNLLGQANAVMAPLVPLFNILDAVIAVFNAVKAVPDALGPPPDPSLLAEVVPAAAEKVDALLKLIPQLSVPLMVVGIIDCIIQFLEGIRDQLASIIEQIARIADSATTAAELGDANLQLIVDCASENVSVQMDAMNKSLEPMNRLIGVLNIFLGLIGLPEVPELGALLESGDPEQALAPLEQVIALLTQLRSAVPVP